MASYPKQKLMSFKSAFGFCLNEGASISLTKNKLGGGYVRGSRENEVRKKSDDKWCESIPEIKNFNVVVLCIASPIFKFLFYRFFPQRYLTFNLGCKLLNFCNLFISLKIFKSIFGNMFTDLSQNIEICHKILKLIWILHMLPHLNKSNFFQFNVKCPMFSGNFMIKSQYLIIIEMFIRNIYIALFHSCFHNNPFHFSSFHLTKNISVLGSLHLENTSTLKH